MTERVGQQLGNYTLIRRSGRTYSSGDAGRHQNFAHSTVH